MKQPRTTIFAFLAGLILCLLQEENLELTEELFQPRAQGGLTFSQDEPPYDGQADAASMVSEARIEAKVERKFLIVTFGASAPICQYAFFLC